MDDEAEIQKMIDEAAKLIRSVYGRAFQAGGLAMRESILQAASSPMSMGGGKVTLQANDLVPSAPTFSTSHQTFTYPPDPIVGTDAARRAPRGLVERMLQTVLTDFPGESIPEIVERVRRRRPSIAVKTIGNQLRRGEGTLYRRDGKYSWFLIGQAEKETAPPEGDAVTADSLFGRR